MYAFSNRLCQDRFSLSAHSSKLCYTVNQLKDAQIDKARHKAGRVSEKSAITSVIYRRQKVWLHTPYGMVILSH